MKQISEPLVQSCLPTCAKDVYKGQLGIGGNYQIGGAIILVASATLYSGAGLVSVVSDPVNHHALHSRDPKALSVFKLIMSALQSSQNIVIDADAIYLFTHYLKQVSKGKQIFTPHLGEWEILSGISKENENSDANKTAQEKLASTVLLKKSRTEIYFPAEIWQNTTGNPAMATGGMGNALAGIIDGLLGQFADKDKAILNAVFSHNLTAADLSNAQYVTLPQQTICQLPKNVKRMTDKDKGGI